MPTATLEAHHKLSSQLSAEAIDTAHGIIRGATVAKSGVQATGHFYIAPDGKEYPVFTDEQTLATLMVAAKAAGKRVKVRTDHMDKIGARAGYADEFRLTEDGRVTADIHLFKSFGDREVVLETSQETPEEIGLSIDFTRTFELREGKAMMRVSELHAVDIVDEGAITHGGMFLSAGVDTKLKVETSRKNMASPTIDELMASIAETNKGYEALTKQVAAIADSLGKLTAPPAKEEAKKDDEALKAAKAEAAKLAAEEIKAQVAAAVKEENLKLKRERAALRLGYTSEDQKAKLATANAEEIEKIVADKKDYLSLVAERAESAKCSRAAANRAVRETPEGREAYKSYIAGLNNGAGIYRKERMAMVN